MNYILYLIRNYPFSSLLIAAIWVLCLMPVPETPLSDVSFVDKWAHVLMYLGTCSVIWLEYWRKHHQADKKKLFLLAWLAPVFMSGLIELVQAYCTGGRRNGDWLDFAANTLGVTLGAVFGLILMFFARR